MNPAAFRWALLTLCWMLLERSAVEGQSVTATARRNLADSPELWRQEHRIVDLHLHVDGKEESFARAVRIMDAVGIGVGVNLSGGTVTPGEDGTSQFARVKEM